MGLGPEAIKVIGLGLAALATPGFVFTGLGLLGVSGLESIWRPLANLSAVVSLLSLICFWHAWLMAGVLISAAVLLSRFWLTS